MGIPAGTQNPYISISAKCSKKAKFKKKKREKNSIKLSKKNKKNSSKSSAEGLSATELTLSADESENQL